MAESRHPPTDDELRRLWRIYGGNFHGPNVETGTMPEAGLLPLLRELIVTGMPAIDGLTWHDPAKVLPRANGWFRIRQMSGETERLAYFNTTTKAFHDSNFGVKTLRCVAWNHRESAPVRSTLETR